MGLEELREEIRENARKEVERIRTESETECGRIVDDAKGKAKSILDDVKAEVVTAAKNEANERESTARLEAKKIISVARERVVENVLGEISRNLVEVTKRGDYPVILERLVAEGLSEMKDGEVLVNRRDRDIVKKMEGIEVSDGYQDCVGGAVIRSKDGKIVVDCTLDAKFELRKDELRRKIYREIFGNG